MVWLGVNSSHFTKVAETKDWAKTHRHIFPTLHDAIDSDPWIEDPKAGDYVGMALAALKAHKPVGKNDVKPYGCSVKYKRQ